MASTYLPVFNLPNKATYLVDIVSNRYANHDGSNNLRFDTSCKSHLREDSKLRNAISLFYPFLTSFGWMNVIGI